MAVYQLSGLNLPRSSKEQYNAGASLARDRLMKGDLTFYVTKQSKVISHMGIYVGNEAFIHAPGKDKKIRKDSLVNSYFRNHFVGASAYSGAK